MHIIFALTFICEMLIFVSCNKFLFFRMQELCCKFDKKKIKIQIKKIQKEQFYVFIYYVYKYICTFIYYMFMYIFIFVVCTMMDKIFETNSSFHVK